VEMRVRLFTCILVLLGSLIASACSTASTPTEIASMSSDDVLRTAEAIAELTRTASTETPTPSPVSPSVTLVQETSTPEPTATPEAPMVTALYNANIRSGPGENYPVIDFILEGQQGEPIGRFDHPDTGIWWYIDRVGDGLNGWVWNGAVDFSGNSGVVPYFEAPPTQAPTSAPTNTQAPTATPTEE
jgi:uncharacterized protein YgiM (DUF1202 family)